MLTACETSGNLLQRPRLQVPAAILVAGEQSKYGRGGWISPACWDRSLWDEVNCWGTGMSGELCLAQRRAAEAVLCSQKRFWVTMRNSSPQKTRRKKEKDASIQNLDFAELCSFQGKNWACESQWSTHDTCFSFREMNQYTSLDYPPVHNTSPKAASPKKRPCLCQGRPSFSCKYINKP